MPHSSQPIIPADLSNAFSNNNVIPYLKGLMLQSELDQYFPALLLREGTLGELNGAATLYNAFLANHNNNNNNDNEDEENGFSTDIYKQFTDNDIASTERTTVSSGLFSGGATSLSEFYFSPTLGDVSASYIPVYDKVTSDSTAQVQFAVGYANYGGSGSIGNTTKTTAGNRETAALYRQFRNVILGQGTEKFAFTGKTYGTVTGGDPDGQDDFVFIAFNRAQMREKVDPGNWELHLSGSGHLESGIKLIDDSSATTNTTINSANRVFNVVSGSITSGTADIKTAAASETTYGAPGLFYPDLGVILLNAAWLSSGGQGFEAGSTANSSGSMVFSTGTNTFGDNAKVAFNSISHSVAGAGAKNAAYFAARREEEISSTSYFARAHNKEFNFSSNPTYETTDSTGTRGAFTQPTFKGDPKAYITQVGLYDGMGGDLLAVAKLSQPVLKSFSREAIIKVKLDF